MPRNKLLAKVPTIITALPGGGTMTAALLATELLSGVNDRAGNSMISHAVRVYEAVRYQHPTIGMIALLHDCIEDSSLTAHELYKELLCRDIDDERSLLITMAVNFLTRRKSETYKHMIGRIRFGGDSFPAGTTGWKAYWIARRVKLADIADHLTVTPSAITPSMVQRYELAAEILHSYPTKIPARIL
jgi:hypothetical protein